MGKIALNEWLLSGSHVDHLNGQEWALAHEGVDGGSCGYADDASKQSGNGDQLPTSYAVRSGAHCPIEA